MSIKGLFLSIAPVMIAGFGLVLVSCKSLSPQSESVAMEEGAAPEAKETDKKEESKEDAPVEPSEVKASEESETPKKGPLSWWKKSEEPAPEETPGKDKPLDLGADANQLLAMTFEEAKAISPQSLIVPPNYRLAADEIQILQTDRIGRPIKVRAKGKVFLQIDFQERLIALSQEAYIESHGESIVRGRPLLKRGKSVIEGLSDYTVYYVRGSRLQAIGKHRVLKQEFGYVPSRKGSSGQGAVSNVPIPVWNVTPSWNRAWQDGPNPLLPALSPQDVPADMRATPLLPPIDDAADLPAPPPTSGEMTKEPEVKMPEEAPPSPSSDPVKKP